MLYNGRRNRPSPEVAFPMVDTVFFVLQFIGLGVLLHWALTHDKPGDSAAEGVLAMRPAEPSAEGALSRPGRAGLITVPRRNGRRWQGPRRSGSG